MLGARQAGKSTLVENVFKNTLKTIVFDPVIDIGNARPSFLESWLSGKVDDAALSNISRPLFPDIWRGGYPKLMAFPDHLIPGYFESYLRTYIERDIRTVSNIGSLQHFGKFFRECFPTEQIGKGLVICAIETPGYLSEDVYTIPLVVHIKMIPAQSCPW